MAATNTFINWHTVTWTPTTGSPVTITRVTDVKPSRTGPVEAFKGDIAVFDQVVAVPSQMRTLDVDSGDVKTLMGIAVGATGALIATLDDANNGSTTAGGGFTVSLTHCVVTGNTAQGPHAKFASATISFQGYATDGTTDPMVITAL